ncbi:hypothetical protein PG997_002679 [Apiospora hydei]|uniref:Uncharacterized protein n=1 Tax=Apiospora hydei TaxID=1337664 RepID=A0ABR1WX73_9PEZI
MATTQGKDRSIARTVERAALDQTCGSHQQAFGAAPVEDQSILPASSIPIATVTMKNNLNEGGDTASPAAPATDITHSYSTNMWGWNPLYVVAGVLASTIVAFMILETRGDVPRELMARLWPILLLIIGNLLIFGFSITEQELVRRLKVRDERISVQVQRIRAQDEQIKAQDARIRVQAEQNRVQDARIRVQDAQISEQNRLITEQNLGRTRSNLG